MHFIDATGDGEKHHVVLSVLSIFFFLFNFFFWQRNFSMSVNSAAVLRLTGRGGGTVVGAPRGRSSSRGRGELLSEKVIMEEEVEDRKSLLKYFNT